MKNTISGFDYKLSTPKFCFVVAAVFFLSAQFAFGGDTPVSVNSCRDISQSGNYELTANLNAPTGQNCITIHDTTNVNLDCHNYSISLGANYYSAVNVTNTSNFVIKNCAFDVINFGSNRPYLIDINNSPRGLITNNTFNKGAVNAFQADNLSVLGNVFTGGFLQIYNSNNLDLENNNIKLDTDNSYVGEIVVSSSTGSKIINNQLDGGVPGPTTYYNAPGSDLGIALMSVTNTLVSGNTISHNWGCGLELLGYISNLQVLNNHIISSGLGGFCGWYGLSMLGNTYADNVVDDTPDLFWIYRSYSLGQNPAPADEQYVYFKDNIFKNNKLTSQMDKFGGAKVVSSKFDWSNIFNGIPADKFILGNNVFTNNDFLASGASPSFAPASAIVDGGGNICGVVRRQEDFPLNCNATPPTPQTATFRLNLGTNVSVSEISGVIDFLNPFIPNGPFYGTVKASVNFITDNTGVALINLPPLSTINLPAGFPSMVNLRIKVPGCLSKIYNAFSYGTQSGIINLPKLIIGDFNGDNLIDISDANFLIKNINTKNLQYDLNGDGKVSFEDLQPLVNNWLKKGE